jgi:hypothetical protein
MIALVFDYQYFLYVGPFLLLALWAQWKVKGTFARYAELGLRSGVSGAEVAALILRNSGLPDVRIEAVEGMLSDHYDPTTRTVRLSRDVLTGRSAAAVAVAAHECGHALQHAQGYQAMQWRTALVPVVNLVNTLAMPMFLFGMFLVPFQVFALIAVNGEPHEVAFIAWMDRQDTRPCYEPHRCSARTWPHGHEARLRARRMRHLHGAHRRHPDPLLPHPRGRGRRQGSSTVEGLATRASCTRCSTASRSSARRSAATARRAS